MVIKGGHNLTVTPSKTPWRVEKGEVDTSSPFQSVKDAVSLFGVGAFSGEKTPIKKPKPESAERALATEAQLHITQRELNKLKEQLKSAETTKAEALIELEKARGAVSDLNLKLEVVNVSRDASLQATEAAKQYEETKPGSDDAARKQDLETDGAARKQDLDTDRAARKQDLETDRPARKQDLETDGAARKQDLETDRPTRKQDLETEGAARKRDLEIDRAARKRDLETDRAARKQDLETEGAARKRDLETEGAARKQVLETDRAARKQDLETDRPTRKQDLETEGAARKRDLETEGAARKQVLETDRAARKQDLETDRPTRKQDLETEGAARKRDLEIDRAARKRDLEIDRAARKRDLETDRAARKQVLETEGAARKRDLETDSAARKQVLESTIEQYKNVFAELSAKQQFQELRQNSDANLEAKSIAINQAVEADYAATINRERVNEISEEIIALDESIGQLKLASTQAWDEQATEKDNDRESSKATLEESTNKLFALKEEFDPEVNRNLELQLAEIVNEIDHWQRRMDTVRTIDVDELRTVTSKLGDAKESLQKLADEESSLHSVVESLKLELEDTKKENCQLKEKELEMETIAENLHVKLRKSTSDLEACLAEESKTRENFEEMMLALSQLSSVIENARQEAVEMKTRAEELKKEAEAANIILREARKKLRVAIEEAEEAKTSEERALGQVKTISIRTNAAGTSTSDSNGNITISKEEFEYLSRKVEESDQLAEMKVAAALAQVDAVKASEKEALKKLETTEKEIKDIKAATLEALKRADMAEAAKKAVEGELRRWNQQEQKKAAAIASRIFAETEVTTESPSQKHNSGEKITEVWKPEKARTSISKKVLLTNISTIFHRKKNQNDGGSPSFLPAEKLFLPG